MHVVVTGKSGAAEFECAPGERILHAGLAAGADLPYECASGTCGSCRARLVSGEVSSHWDEAPGRKYCKAERNEILMCQSAALTDCTLAVSKVVEQAKTTVPSFMRGRIQGMHMLTSDVCAFEVVLERPISFTAGQFMLLTTPGIPGGRAYSMTNYAHETAVLEFLVKRLPAGRFTAWLFGPDSEGADVALFGPLGRAVFEPEIDRPIICIAGGSGIAGMGSILRRAADAEYFTRHAGRVFFGVRTAADGFWLAKLSAFAAAAPGRLEVTVALSHEAPTPELAARYPNLRFDQGFVHEVAGRVLAGPNGPCMAYVAGPPPMVDAALRMLLLELRLGASSIRYDKFS